MRLLGAKMRIAHFCLVYWSSFGDEPYQISFGNLHRLYQIYHIFISRISLQIQINWSYSNKDSSLFLYNVVYNIHRYNFTRDHLMCEYIFKLQLSQKN